MVYDRLDGSPGRQLEKYQNFLCPDPPMVSLQTPLLPLGLAIYNNPIKKPYYALLSYDFLSFILCL